jgi:hypothetical protein
MPTHTVRDASSPPYTCTYRGDPHFSLMTNETSGVRAVRWRNATRPVVPFPMNGTRNVLGIIGAGWVPPHSSSLARHIASCVRYFGVFAALPCLFRGCPRVPIWDSARSGFRNPGILHRTFCLSRTELRWGSLQSFDQILLNGPDISCSCANDSLPRFALTGAPTTRTMRTGKNRPV